MNNKFVYKIFTRNEWKKFSEDRFVGSHLDISSGFIHLSSKNQINATINKFFKTKTSLVIAGFKVETLGSKLKWEEVYKDKFFPHFYGKLFFKHLNNFRLYY